MATRSMNTLTEAFPSLMNLIAEMKLMPDAQAHLPKLIQLETAVIQMANEIRNPAPAGPAPGMNELGMGGPPPMAGPAPARAGNLTPAVGAPNPDELRRLMS